MKLGISNEDATCRLGFRDAAGLTPTTPVRIQPKSLFGCPKRLYAISRNGCTVSTVLAVRLRPKRLFVFARFTHAVGWVQRLACSSGAELSVSVGLIASFFLSVVTAGVLAT
ncbi:MAG TPA: hypothetical protein VKT26_04330 [Acetobacteraceae bacterium]|nr:hypothetical protein [Acetobacteraceae bacterium]